MQTRRISLGLIFALFIAAQAQVTPPTVDNTRIAEVMHEGFRDFARWYGGKTLEQRVADANGDIVIPWQRTTEIANLDKSKPENSDKRLEPTLIRSIKSSHLIVIAKVVRNISSETENHNFVFTASQLQITETLKSDPTSFQGPAFVLWPGGWVKAGGHRVTVSISDSRPLRVGNEYLLVLSRTQTPGVFTIHGAASYELSSQNIESIEPKNSRVSKDFTHIRADVIDTFKFNIEQSGANQ
jgi:hypothetical protein